MSIYEVRFESYEEIVEGIMVFYFGKFEDFYFKVG